MKQKLYFLITVCVVSGQFFMQGALDDDFDDTPVIILFEASPGQLASITPLDQQAYKNLMNELKAFQYRFFDNLLSLEEAPFVLKKLQTKSQLMLADKDSQEKFNEHLKNVAGHYRIRFVN